MSWTSRTLRARFDFHTPLDAAAKPTIQQYVLRTLERELEGVRVEEIYSIRRLARGQIRVDTRLRFEGDNRLVVSQGQLRKALGTLVGSAKYLSLRGVPMPLVRLYRTRLLT